MGRSANRIVAALLLSVALSAHAQDQASLQKGLASQFALTKTTADNSDIVTVGSMLVLHKDGLLLCSVEAKAPLTNTYKNGNISYGFGAKLAWGAALGKAHEEKLPANIPKRKFSAGEKIWITSYSALNDGVLLQLYSDPYNDIRYYGQLNFPFSKGAIPSTDDLLKTIAEVVTVEPADNSSGGRSPSQATVPGARTPAPIAPPPAPPDTPPPPPKTIALGQTKDQVVAAFGQPQKVATVGAKEIDYYPDMKVTLVNGKVTDVE